MGEVSPGDKFRPKASEWNAFRDAADFTSKLRLEGAVGAVARGMRPDTILVKNKSGEAAPSHGVLALGEESVLSTDMDETRFGGSVPCIEAVAPNNTTRAWCVLLEPLAPGQIGRAQVSGVALVRIDNAIDGMTASPQTGSFAMASGCGGAQLIWKDPNAEPGEECWALVRVNGAPPDGCLVGRLASDLEGGIAEVEVFTDDWGAPSDDDCAVFCVPEVSQLSTIPEGTTILAHRILGQEEALTEEEA